MLKVLKTPENELIYCDRPASESPFVYNTLSGSKMGNVWSFTAAFKGSQKYTWKDVLAEWISDKCPMKSLEGTVSLFHASEAPETEIFVPKPGRGWVH
jgi:hypothetical protein